METVHEILGTQDIHGMEDMDVNEAYTVEKDPHMDLSLEKVGEDDFMVAHFYTQRGDLMSDPQIVYRVENYDEPGDFNDGWVPIRYRQDGFPQVYEYNEQGLDQGVRDFCRTWDENLEKQGFVEAARQGHIK